MHSGGNYRWVPLSKSFENNNDNKKRYRAQKFYFTISSAVSSIQLHSGGQILLFSWAENSRRPSPVWTTYYGVTASGNVASMREPLDGSLWWYWIAANAAKISKEKWRLF